MDITLPKGQSVRIVSDVFPERTFLFRPLVLKGDLLAAYASPDLLNLYESRSSNAIVGRAGGSFTASEQSDQFALVTTSSGLAGYLRLPAPAAASSSATNFTGAIIRILRSDWTGAEALLELVASDQQTPTSVLIDTRLLEAYCLERQGKSGHALVSEARRLNPTATRTMIFDAMVQFAGISREVSRGHSLDNMTSTISSLRDSIERAARGLNENDEWVAAARKARNMICRYADFSKSC